MCENWDNNFYTPPPLGGGGGGDVQNRSSDNHPRVTHQHVWSPSTHCAKRTPVASVGLGAVLGSPPCVQTNHNITWLWNVTMLCISLSLSLSLSLYIYIYMYMHHNVCIHIYIYVYVCMCIYIYIYIDIHICVYTYIYIYIYIHICTYTWITHDYNKYVTVCLQCSLSWWRAELTLRQSTRQSPARGSEDDATCGQANVLYSNVSY